LLLLVAVITALGVYLYTHKAPPVAPPDAPELGGEVTAVFDHYRHLETEGGKDKYLLTADVATAYSNGSHDLQKVELVFFGVDGTHKDHIKADSGIYNQSNALVIFKSNVTVDTTDGLHVETDVLKFNQETHVADLEGPTKYTRQNVEGVCRDATVEMDQNRLQMHHDVDMTFKSTDDKPDTAANGAAPADKPEKNKEGKKGKGGGGGKKKKQQEQTAQNGGSAAPAVDFSKGPRIPVRVRSASAAFDKPNLVARYEGGVIVTREQDEMRGDVMTAYLTDMNRFRKIEVRGNAYLKAAGKAEATAPSMDFMFVDANQLQTAIGTGGARMVSLGEPPTRTVTSDRIEMDMAPGQKGSELHEARANGQAIVTMDAPEPTTAHPNPAARELRADNVTLDMQEGGQYAKTADATGNALLTVTPIRAEAGAARRKIAAPHQHMEFFETNNAGREFSADGGVRVDIEPLVEDGHPPRTTTSETAHATFDRESQNVTRMDQDGEFKYVEGDRNATSNHATYTASDDLTALRGASSNGRPTVWDTKSRTQGDEIDIYSKEGTSEARGDVRTTYYSPESAGNTTPFKTKSPVFLTAERLDARRSDGGVAIYTGAARAWQDDNYVRGDTITLYDADRRTDAQGNVESVLYSATSKGETGAAETVPVFTTATRMTYSDAERKVHYEGNVYSRQAPDEIKSDVQDVWLTEGSDATVDHMIAVGNVYMTEPGRTGKGDRLVYTAADQKAVLTGTNARVEDAKQGTSTGEELTFFVGGERIRVAGRNGAGRVKSTHRVTSKGAQ
jgi:lipopolysaccharide export system protein LptA